MPHAVLVWFCNWWTPNAFWNEVAQDPCSKRTNVFFFRVWHNPSERSPLDKGRWSHLASAVDRSVGCSNSRRWPHRPSHIQLSLTFLALVFLGKALKIVTVERPFAMRLPSYNIFFSKFSSVFLNASESIRKLWEPRMNVEKDHQPTTVQDRPQVLWSLTLDLNNRAILASTNH